MPRIVPSAKRSCNVPSTDNPEYNPSRLSPEGRLTAIAVPTGCAAFCHARNTRVSPPSRHRLSHTSNAFANISQAACGCGGITPNVVKSVTGRSSPSGWWARLRPTPMTTASAERSSSMPDSFSPFADSISLGHLILITISGAISQIVSTTAKAVTKASDDNGGSSGRERTIVLVKRLPDLLSQTRPKRPRPLSCASARSHRPSGAPDVMRARRSALVEPVNATCSKMGVRTTPSLLVPITLRALVSRHNRVVTRRVPALRRSMSERDSRWQR